MTDWTAGYVADIEYTYGYYHELNPSRIRLAFLSNGLVCPDIINACELGFGQGLSVNIHAAASGVKWFGTDFNPAQAGFAQDLAAKAGAGTRLHDETFADFASRTDLPEFDYIGLHGIWSWVSDENRAVIVDFVRRKLKVGGVLYISYNTLPGWAAFAPMRHLMTEHVDTLGSAGNGVSSRIDGALDFTEKLLVIDPRYVKANPQVADWIKQVKEQSRHYLAHEYFNRDWHPMHFSSVAKWLAPAKIEYGCSATYLEHIDVLNLTAEQQEFLKAIPDSIFRETVRDFMVNQQFRRDYWIKGARRLSKLEQAEALRTQKIILTSPRQDISLKVSGTLGEATLNESIYSPILDFLSDHKAKTIGQLEQFLRGKTVEFHQIMQVIMVLTGAGHIALVQDDDVIERAKLATERLNVHLIDKARGSTDIAYLSSPVTGGGVHVGRIQQLFLLAMHQGQKQPNEWAETIWQLLAVQGQRIIKDGKQLETAEENLAELKLLAKVFVEKQLPILTALKVM
jgi:SAM-dependent methyltransferase